MTQFKVGVQLQPQGSDVGSLLGAAAAFDESGVDSIWTWDHFFPIYGDPGAASFECYTLLSAMACRTRRATLGALVTSSSYRNPDLLADMARTVDHISDGRFVLGMGAGWFERDYDEYGYEFGTARERLAALESNLLAIKRRLGLLSPAPMGSMPILVGGSGPRVTLRIVAEHADQWNTFGPPERFAELNAILDEWCGRVGRDPGEIERTVAISPHEVDDCEAFIEAGARHLIVMLPDPFDAAPVRDLLNRRR